MEKEKQNIVQDVEAVVTSYNQGNMILEAVSSLCAQTMLPAGIFVTDDGSTEPESLEILEELEKRTDLPVPLRVLRRSNGGVSAARNTGISSTRASMVLVLDGDDKLEPFYLQKVSGLLRENPCMVAASSWMRTFGVLEAEVRPCGGDIRSFLSRNCCPATHILRRQAWEACGGYDASMRRGFEDWEFFLSLLETEEGAKIGIVEEPLIEYRTAAASSNIQSMSKRLELMSFIMKKHHDSYLRHMEDALLGIEAVSMERLYGWEEEMRHTLRKERALSKVSQEFIERPTYGDGGMAAAVRIASAQKDE